MGIVIPPQPNPIHKFIVENLGSEPYSLVRLSIINSGHPFQIDWDKVPKAIINRAERDLKFFDLIEANRTKYDKPIVGDYVRRLNGRLTKIGIFLTDDKFQDTAGGSFYVHERGYGSYSGGFTGDILSINNLRLTNQMLPLYVWTFSGNQTCGGYGVYKHINVKVWQEIGVSIYNIAISELPSDEIGHYNSDLYLKVTEASKKIVDAYEFKSNVKTFRSSIDHSLWFDIPFAFQPFWDKINTLK